MNKINSSSTLSGAHKLRPNVPSNIISSFSFYPGMQLSLEFPIRTVSGLFIDLGNHPLFKSAVGLRNCVAQFRKP